MAKHTITSSKAKKFQQEKKNGAGVQRKHKDYIGPWTVRFKCGQIAFVSQSNPYDIGPMAMKLHVDAHPECDGGKCKAVKFIQERIARCRQNMSTRRG